MRHRIDSGRRPRDALLAFLMLLTASLGCYDSPVTPEAGHAGAPVLSKGQGQGDLDVQGAQQYRATAEFHQSRATTSTVLRWDAEVIVTETLGKDPGATLWFRYSVRDPEGLFYTDLWPCEGTQCPLDRTSPVSIDPDDITIDPSLRRATLDVEVPVADGESGTLGTVHLQVTWEREKNGGRSKPVVASLEIEITSGSFPRVEDLPSSTLVDAELTRIKPEPPEWPGVGTDGQATAEWHLIRPFHEIGASDDWEFGAEVIVTETHGEDPEATVWFRYSMAALEATFSSVIGTPSPVRVDPDDITIHPSLGWATLDTEISVLDFGTDIRHTAHIRVTWERDKSGVVAASLAIDAPGRIFADLPFSSTVDAELSRNGP